MVVFDVTRPETFKNVEIWKRDIDTKCGPIPSLLLGNKVRAEMALILGKVHSCFRMTAPLQ